MKTIRKVRKRRWIFVLILLSGIVFILEYSGERVKLKAPGPVDLSLESCTTLISQGPLDEFASISAPGKHCFTVNFGRLEVSAAGHTSTSWGNSVVYVSAGDVIIDLGGRTLTVDGLEDGIALTKNVKNITIQNGVIDLRGVGAGVAFDGDWDMTFIKNVPTGSFKGYENTKFKLRNLTIRSDNIGVKLQGTGNVIQNCVIESGGDFAIAMAGQDGRITESTIVLNDPFISARLKRESRSDISILFERFFQYKRMTRAAIVLHDASGTEISSNRIEVKGKSDTRHNILVTHGSKNVRIEDNIFGSLDDWVTLFPGSTAQLARNAVAPDEKKNWRELR